MVKRKSQVPVKLVTGFDDQPGELVDVFPNEKGEFVQIWNQRRDGRIDSPGRVIFSYQRTPYGVESVNRCIILNEGPYSRATINKNGLSLQYSESQLIEDCRFEKTLFSGRVLVTDPKCGAFITRTWTRKFDWKSLKPKGKALGDRSIINCHRDNLEYFITTSQETRDGDTVVDTDVAMVERFIGTKLVEFAEVAQGKLLESMHWILGQVPQKEAEQSNGQQTLKSRGII